MKLKPYHSAEGITIYKGDCLEILPILIEQGLEVDHVITDPPYEAQAHTMQRRVKRMGEQAKSTVMSLEPLSFVPITVQQRRSFGQLASAITKRWCLTFCQVEASQLWVRAYQGMSYKRTCVWIKPDGQPNYSGDKPGMGYESIVAMHATGGKSHWNGGGRVGVFRHNTARSQIHQTTKPLNLMRELVALFTDPSELILDPFMGSGTTLLAAKQLGRRAIGIELEEKWCDLAVKRLTLGNVKNVDGVGIHAKACRYPVLDCICHLVEKRKK